MRRGENEMLTRDKLTKALKQTAEMARSALAQGSTSDRGIAAQEAHRAVQEADEYLAAGDMLEAYGLFCFASGKLCDSRAYWKERFRWLFLPEQPRPPPHNNAQSTASRSDQQK